MGKTFLIILCLLAVNTLFAQTNDGCTASNCHANAISRPVVHAPAEEDCSICHEQLHKEHPREGKVDFVLMDTPPALCLACHELPKIDIHIWHAAEGKNCLLCHVPHSSDAPSLLTTTKGTDCAGCHDFLTNQQTIHAPVEEGECLLCHEPEEANAPFPQLEVPTLCYVCHDDKQAVAESDFAHAVVEECTECHSPHSSGNPSLVKIKVPLLCYQCHEDMQEQVSSMPIVHGPLKEYPACLSCHNPHGADRATLLKDEPQELCLSCHNREIKGESMTVDNIGKKLSESVVHGAIEMDGCGTCHVPHFSEISHLLNDQFPKGHYASGDENSFALCFNCHDSELMTTETTTSATEFRNGEKNLHFKHLHREKARSCTNCHDVHGSDKDHLINDFFEFGQWKIPFDYKETPDGGSCNIGCHAVKHYSRE